MNKPVPDKLVGKRKDIEFCLGYLESRALDAGLCEAAFLIGIARLSAADALPLPSINRLQS